MVGIARAGGLGQKTAAGVAPLAGGKADIDRQVLNKAYLGRLVTVARVVPAEVAESSDPTVLERARFIVDSEGA